MQAYIYIYIYICVCLTTSFRQCMFGYLHLYVDVKVGRSSVFAKYKQYIVRVLFVYFVLSLFINTRFKDPLRGFFARLPV